MLVVQALPRKKGRQNILEGEEHTGLAAIHHIKFIKSSEEGGRKRVQIQAKLNKWKWFYTLPVKSEVSECAHITQVKLSKNAFTFLGEQEGLRKEKR